MNVSAQALQGAFFLKQEARPEAGTGSDLEETVAGILSDVRAEGDAALDHYSQKFDGIEVERIEVTEAERAEALEHLSPQAQEDSRFAIDRVRSFAEAQLATMTGLESEPLPGLHLGHRVIPVRRVGAYVPGGRYPLLSAPIMTIVPAKVAGCEEVVACLPPTADPGMIAVCDMAGADRIYRVGGAQAIGAMAYGTESVQKVDKIVGPGNAFVNEAKRQVFGEVGIDQLAGPSEIYVLADETGDPEIIATDLLAQAEHDIRTRVGLITTSRELAERTMEAVEAQLETLSSAAVARPAWRDYGQIIVCPDHDTMVACSEEIAAEHLQVHTADPHATARQLNNYGSLFIGVEASVVYSDKCCGTNHTLPTMGTAKYTGGLWVGTYLKVCTHQWMDARGVAAVAPSAARQSEREQMEGHRRAAQLRLDRMT